MGEPTWPLGGPKHGFNGFVAIMRDDYRADNDKRHSPAWEVLVEVEGVGCVSAWVGDHQRRTPVGEPLWVWKRQITTNGRGEPLVRQPPFRLEVGPEVSTADCEVCCSQGKGFHARGCPLSPEGGQKAVSAHDLRCCRHHPVCPSIEAHDTKVAWEASGHAAKEET